MQIKSFFTFNLLYFIPAALLFIAEWLIAVYAHDSFIRPFGGDFLVVIFVYCCVKAFANISINAAAIFALLFAYTVEVSQYFKLVVHLGLKGSRLANIVLGNSFSWIDMAMYTLGILMVVALEKIRKGLLFAKPLAKTSR